MTFNAQPRPSWQLIEVSLGAVDLRSLEESVSEWLDEFMPRTIARNKGRPHVPELALLQRRLDLVVSRHLGPWYGWNGWRMANESFGGCFCHSFVSEFALEPRREGVKRATQWTVAEVEVMLRCLREFRFHYELFDHPDDPGDLAIALSATMGRVFDTVVNATAGSAAWGRFVTDGFLWMLDHRDIETSTALETLFHGAVDALCTEALPPTPGERYRLCDDLSAVVVQCLPALNPISAPNRQVPTSRKPPVNG